MQVPLPRVFSLAQKFAAYVCISLLLPYTLQAVCLWLSSPSTGWRQAHAHHGSSPLFFLILTPEVQFALLCTVLCTGFSHSLAICLLLLTLHVHGYRVGVCIWFYGWSTFHSMDRPLFLYSFSHMNDTIINIYVRLCVYGFAHVVVVGRIKLSTWNTLESLGKGFPGCLDQTGRWTCLWEVTVIMVIEVGRSAHHEQHHFLVRETRTV